MPARQRAIPWALFLLAVSGLGRAARAGCPDCRHVLDCERRRCCVDCASPHPEADLRRAVAAANRCASHPAFRRTIQFTTAGGCTIDMTQVSRVATCAGDPLNAGRQAVCLMGHDITIDGGNQVTFNYAGPIPCQACAGACLGVQPALFSVHGRANTLTNFTMQYFPSGIVIRGGSGHAVDHVTDRFICGHAVDVAGPRPGRRRGAGRNIRVVHNTFVGHSAAGPDHVCLDPHDRPSPCGLDKAIQIDGGSVTVADNHIDRIGQPVEIIGGLGTHVVSGNTTVGDPADQNVCEAYTVSASFRPAAALFSGNTIDFCKFGIRVIDGAVVEADGNTITDAYVSAFQVSRAKRAGGALLKGTGNRVRRAGFFTEFACQVGALVDLNDPSARIDFGGGDFEGQPVIGGTRSPGGNWFCQGGLNAVWNLTDGCVADGAPGGSIGLRGDCVDVVPPRVQDSPPGTVATDGTVQCTPAQCDF